MTKKWAEFKVRYFKELDNNGNPVNVILDKIKEVGSITLLYGAKHEKLINAIVLK